MLALPEHVHCVKARGRPYYYYHPGRGTPNEGERVRLPSDPNLPEFWEAYQRLAGQRQPAATGPAPGSVDALVAAYKASPDFTRKAAKTQKDYERHFRIIDGPHDPAEARPTTP